MRSDNPLLLRDFKSEDGLWVKTVNQRDGKYHTISYQKWRAMRNRCSYNSKHCDKVMCCGIIYIRRKDLE